MFFIRRMNYYYYLTAFHTFGSYMLFAILFLMASTGAYCVNNNNTVSTQTMSTQLAELTNTSTDHVDGVMRKWLGKREWDAATWQKFDEQVAQPVRNLRVALIVVDFQNDFVDGSLKISDGDAGQDPNAAIGPLNELLTSSQWDMVVYTKDWHLANHISFLSQAHNSDREMEAKDANRTLNVFDSVDFAKPIKTTQVLYPDHCVQTSWGSEIHPEIVVLPDAPIVYKGVDAYLDSYSAFFDNNGLSQTELNAILEKNSIDAVVVAGLAYDICVKYTCLDAIKLDYLSAVVPACSAGLLAKGVADAEREFAAAGVAIISPTEAHSISSGAHVPREWLEKVAERGGA